MIFPANNGNLPPNVTKSLPQVIVGIEKGLAPLVDQINVSKLNEVPHFHMTFFQIFYTCANHQSLFSVSEALEHIACVH